MDNRLDFFNDLNNFIETLTDDDAALVITHNQKDGDCFYTLSGDWEIISRLFTQSRYTNIKEESKESFDELKKAILHIAYNICITDDKIKSAFLNGLNNTKELIVKANKKGYVNCPFCGDKHKHGIGGGNGNRLPDCGNRITKDYIENNITYSKKDGYYVVFE